MTTTASACIEKRESAYFVDTDGEGRHDMNNDAGHEDDDTSTVEGPAVEEEETNVRSPTGSRGYFGGGDAVFKPQPKRNLKSSQGDKKPLTASAAAVHSGRRKHEPAYSAATERPRTAPAIGNGTEIDSVDITNNNVGPAVNRATNGFHRSTGDEDIDIGDSLLSSSPGFSASPAPSLMLADIELVNLHNLSLRKLEGMDRLTRLRVADLSGNELHDITPLRSCECLEVCGAGARGGGGDGGEGGRGRETTKL